VDQSYFDLAHMDRMDLEMSQAKRALHPPVAIYQSGLLEIVLISHLFPLALLPIILTIAEGDASIRRRLIDGLALFVIESWYLE
jgi:hypothetical protein